MRLIQTGSTAVALASMLLLGVAHADSALQKQTLPRSFGPVALGITEEQFKKITGIKKMDFCAHCAIDESMMSVEVEKFPSVYPAYLYTLPKYARGFGASFYKGKLYMIETSPEIEEIKAAKKKYTELYGPPSSEEDWPNGVSWVTWENRTTAFVLAYNREKTGSFFSTIPAGTVTLVRYLDKPLHNALEAQEKKNPSRSHH